MKGSTPTEEAPRRVDRVRPVIGWREWVGLPDLGVDRIKAKVDTGARSSSLHVVGIEDFEQDGAPWLRFVVHPRQRSRKGAVTATAPLLDRRAVRSSSGAAETRPVIETRIELMGIIWVAELTLTRRDAMGFRMLLGRQAFRRRFLVDAGRSFRGDRPRRSAAR